MKGRRWWLYGSSTSVAGLSFSTGHVAIGLGSLVAGIITDLGLRWLDSTERQLRARLAVVVRETEPPSDSSLDP